MKKVIAVMLILVMALALTACGNQNLLWGNFTYEHVHISDAIGGHCFNLEQWNEDATGIELKIEGGSTVFLSEGTYMMFSDSNACPYC
ncbi:MAG: hypothetical protein E7167_01210 [Firmicutes bacterium]|nr:hypothetical protein [Bacillota bacterium]